MVSVQLGVLLDKENTCKEHAALAQAFKRFLTKTHCDENLLFIHATSNFMEKDHEISFEDWKSVYNTYIKQDSPKECNFPESIRIGFDNAFEDKNVPSQDMLKLARFHIITLLKDAYTKFQRQLSGTDKTITPDRSCEVLCCSPKSAFAEEVDFNEGSLVSKLDDFVLDVEEEEEDSDDRESGKLNLSRIDTGLSDRSSNSREASALSPFPQKLSSEDTSADPSRNSSGNKPNQRVLSNSNNQTNEAHIMAPSIRRLHRYSLSSAKNSSTSSSSASSPANSTQKLSKIVNKLKFGRSSSSSGGVSGPQAWQRSSEN